MKTIEWNWKGIHTMILVVILGIFGGYLHGIVTSPKESVVSQEEVVAPAKDELTEKISELKHLQYLLELENERNLQNTKQIVSCVKDTKHYLQKERNPGRARNYKDILLHMSKLRVENIMESIHLEDALFEAQNLLEDAEAKRDTGDNPEILAKINAFISQVQNNRWIHLPKS